MIRPIFIVIFVMFFSQAASAGRLTAELLCEGLWEVNFHSVEGEDAFAAMMLLEVIKEQMTPERKRFSQRLSIKDNVLDERISLEVTDNFIEADETAIPTDVLSDLPYVVQSARLRIDRLTGTITGSIEIDKFDTNNEFFDKNADNTELHKGLAKLIKGFDIEGTCKKLDPKKKLF